MCCSWRWGSPHCAGCARALSPPGGGAGKAAGIAKSPADYWTGGNPAAETSPGPEINDISQLLDAVALGNAVAYVPVSLADQYRSAAGLVFVAVTDLSPSEVVAAWPGTSRSRAVAAFVRAAVEVAADQAEPTPAVA